MIAFDRRTSRDNRYDQYDGRTVWQRLRQCVRADRRRLERPRRNRKKFMGLSLGEDYSDSSKSRVFKNDMAKWRRTFTRLLGANQVGCHVSTPHNELVGLASRCEVALNDQLKTMDFGAAQEECIINSLFFPFGVMAVGYEDAGMATMLDEFGIPQQVPVGSVFAEPISPDDWVHDMLAKRIDDFLYCGHLFLMDLDEAREFDGFDPKLRERLTKTDFRIYNEDGDPRSQTLSAGTAMGGDVERLKDQVAIWWLHLPEDGQVVYLPYDPIEDDRKPLGEMDWTGPEKGPYRYLFYEQVPDNTLPSTPGAIVYPAAWAAMQLAAKATDGALDEKEILAYAGQAADEAQRLVNTGHMGTIRMDDPSLINTLKFNGVSDTLLAMLAQLGGWLDEDAGGLQVLSGAAPVATSGKHESIVQGASNEQLTDMKKAVFKFTQESVGDIAYYWFHDEHRDYPGVLELPGTSGIKIGFNITPDMRRENFGRLNFDIQPFALQALGPVEKMDMMGTILERFIIPLAQLDPNIAPDAQFIVKQFAKLSGIPEIGRMVRFQDGSVIESDVAPRGRAPGGVSAGQKPGGQYTRHSTSGDPATNLAQQVQGMLSGGGNGEQ